MDKIGQVIEYRKRHKLKQTSYCYLAKVIGEKIEPNFTSKENNKGFTAKWVKPEEAIEIIEKDRPNDYEGGFIQKRDLFFLNRALLKLNRF